jgi:hypothetical protein
MLWGENMETILQILQSVSIIIACWVAIFGINAWRREFIGKRRIELAEEVLGAFFAVKDAISYIRSPVSYTDEGSTRKKQNYETEEETKIMNRAYIVFERYGKQKEIFHHFAVLKYRFMAAFGKNEESIFDTTTKILNKILNASETLGTYWQHENDIRGDEIKRKHRDDCESIIYKRDWNDPLQKDIEEVQAKLEVATYPYFEETTYWEKIKRFISAWR